VRWPQLAVAALIVLVYVVVVWSKARDLSISTPRALVTVAAAGLLLLLSMWLLRQGGFW
jgi:hypothetical protein